MKQHLIPAMRLTLTCLVVFSGLYTSVLLGIAKLTPNDGNARTVLFKGRKQYIDLAQSFSRDDHFWSRPSAVAYNAAGSAGSNKGPTNKEYLQAVEARIDTFLVHHPGVQRADVPCELVTASGSGLDPHLSVQGAYAQARRIATAHGLSEAAVRHLIDEHTVGPLFGLFGPSTLNVLELNLALDQLK